MKFYLDAARCGSAWYTSDLLVLEKPSSESNTRGTWEHRLAGRKSHAASYMRCLRALLDSHGSGLRSHARVVYGRCLQAGAMCELLLDKQMESVKLAGRAFAYDPSAATLGMVLLAPCGRCSFEMAYRIRG